MSQNSHKLLLFFSNQEQIKSLFQLLQKLHAGDDEAAVLGQQLGIDITQAWNEEWFNQEISLGPNFLRLVYDTSTGYDMPLDVLQQLFDFGIKAACLEVFHDQVGELSQSHFTDSRLVTREDMFKKFPKLRAVIGVEFEGEAEQLEQEGCRRPCTIKQLIKEKQQNEKDAMTLVEGISDLGKLSRETGENPVELMKSALIIGAAGKGLLHAFVFGLVTILLFKGLWLWVSLTLLLLIALPLIYVMNAQGAFDDDEESNEDNDEDDTESGVQAC